MGYSTVSTQMCALSVSYTLVTLSSKLGTKPGAEKSFILITILLTHRVTTLL